MLTWRFLVFFFLLAIASCKTLPFQVKDGSTARDLLLFNQSINFLLKEYNEEKDPLKQQPIAYQLAESYRKFNDYANAEKWYKQSLDLNGDERSLFQLGLMQKKQEKYTEAIKTFEQYQRVSAQAFEGRKQADQCREAMKWTKDFTKIFVTSVTELNTSAADYALHPFKDNNWILSSSRNEATGSERDGWTGEKFTDLFSVTQSNGKFGNVAPLPSPVSTNAHESSATFSADGKEVYFIRCIDDQQHSNQYCHLYYSAFNNQHWNEPVRLEIFPDSFNVYDPFLSTDGKWMFVASDAPGFGETDLYILTKVDTGWGKPQNLGGTINTPQSERSPWLDEKGNLYFSSDGLPGMGGLDVFKSIKLKNGFREAVNMRAPINSGADDLNFIISKYQPTDNEDTILWAGYFSSNRTGGKGSDDIYRFEERWLNLYVLKGTVTEKEYADPENPDSKILGQKNVGKAKVELRNSNNQPLAATTTDEQGKFSFELAANTEYKINVSKSGYLSSNGQASTVGKQNRDSTLIHVYTTIELEKIFTQKMLVIPNIYYDYDKATLRPESKQVLDSIMIFFNDNPDLTIEIGSHTDSRGSDSYNQKLSQARAQSVVDYFISKGVAPDKLQAKGYGETKLVNGCSNGVNCTEEEHQKNRRTTFRVVSAKLNLDSQEPENIPVVPKEGEE